MSDRQRLPHFRPGMHTPFSFRQVLLAILATAFTHGVAVAEDVKLSTIDVTASAIIDARTQHCTVVGSDELKSTAAATSDSASLLQNTPGLNLQGSGGVSSLPVIHGLADDRLRIKVDGMDLISACGNHMNPALSYIDPSNVGIAAVFAGITPVSIGGDSIGGTILVNSADPEFAKPGEGMLHKGEIGTFYRSNGNAQGGNVAATIAGEEFSVSYRGSTAKADDYKAGDDFKPAGAAAAGRAWLAADEVGSTMYKSTNQSINMALQQNNHLFNLTLGLQDIPYQGWPNQRMGMTGNKSKQANLSYDGQYSWGDLEARVYYETTRHSMQFFEDKLYWYGPNAALDGIPCTPSGGMMGCAAGMPMDTEGRTTGTAIKAHIPLAAGNLLRVGGETQQYRLDDWWDASGKGMWPNTFWNINNGKRDRLALFGEWESEWNSQWLTQFGVRYEKVDMNAGTVQGYSPMMANYGVEAAAFNAADRKKTDNNIDLTASARFTPTETNTIEFGYAMKTRSPNLYERYTWSTGGMVMRMINWAGDGNGYVGNLNLKPEVAHTVSATIDLHDTEGTVGVKLTPYYSYISNYIDAARCSSANANCGAANQTATNAFVYLQFVNQSARMHGIDVSGRLLLAENNGYGSFTATGILNYVRGKNATTDDNLYNIMPLNGRASIVHRLGSWSGTIEAELVGAKTNVSQVRNEVKTAGYGLVHLRGSYEWEHVRIDFGVENLLDRFYNDPLGGVYMGQGKTMPGTGVAWGLAAPGMGRSIYTGANFKF